MMSAIGLLLVKGIYIVLAIPPILELLKFLFFKQKDFKKIILYSIPLILFTLSQYYGYLQEGKRYEGSFYLMKYPNCDKCKLVMEQNHTYYIISSDSVIMETGEWAYKEYGDMSILEIGDRGQFNSGKFTLGRGYP